MTPKWSVVRWTINCLSISIFTSIVGCVDHTHHEQRSLKSSDGAWLLSRNDRWWGCSRAGSLQRCCMCKLSHQIGHYCLPAQTNITHYSLLLLKWMSVSWKKNKKNSIDETLIASMLWSLLWIYHHNHHYPPGSGRMHTIIAHLIQLHKHIILTFFHKAFQIIYFLFLLFFLILPSRLWLYCILIIAKNCC